MQDYKQDPLYKQFLAETQSQPTQATPTATPPTADYKQDPLYKQFKQEEQTNRHEATWDEKIKPYIPDFTNTNLISRVASLFTDKQKMQEAEQNLQGKTVQTNGFGDVQLDKNFSTPTENFLLGGVKSVSEYGASAAKLFDLQNTQNALNGVRRFAEDKIKKNDGEIGGFVGEMVTDPINLLPAGIFTKGTQFANISKSMLVGAGLGAGTMLAKDYGNDDVTAKQTVMDMGVGAGFNATINGVIAALTGGRVKSLPNDVFNHPNGTPKNTNEIVDNMRANYGEIGLTAKEAEAAIKSFYPKVQDGFKGKPMYPTAPMSKDEALQVIFRHANQRLAENG